MTRAALLLAMLACAVMLAVAACTSSSGAAASCPNDLPSSCPMPTPSWDAAVAPIVQTRCSPCHFPGGAAYPAQDFSSYEGVYARRTNVLDQVYGCVMPPAGATPLTPSERAEILGWLVCHAPNN
jgi:hypothetical protein